MKVDGGVGFDLANAAATAKEAEDAGYDGVWSAETSHDPLFPLLLAAGSTETIEWSARRSASPWEGGVSSTAIVFTPAAVSLSA